jgi:hypothetical protein
VRSIAATATRPLTASGHAKSICVLTQRKPPFPRAALYSIELIRHPLTRVATPPLNFGRTLVAGLPHSDDK